LNRTTSSLAPGTGDTRRAGQIAGLRRFADFAEKHPDLPLGTGDPLHVSVSGGTDEQDRAEVDRIARICGVQPRYLHNSTTHYAAVMDCGGVSYQAVAIAHDEMQRYYALMSYQDNVAPRPVTVIEGTVVAPRPLRRAA
jgi:hypothetical protein